MRWTRKCCIRRADFELSSKQARLLKNIHYFRDVHTHIPPLTLVLGHSSNCSIEGQTRMYTWISSQQTNYMPQMPHHPEEEELRQRQSRIDCLSCLEDYTGFSRWYVLFCLLHSKHGRS